MRIFRGLLHPDLRKPTALTIGNMDGVHVGHQAMLQRVVGEAKARGLTSTLLTFAPHPREYFARLHKQPLLAPERIATLRDKLQAIAACGIEQTVLMPFGLPVAQLTAEVFIDTVLQAGLDVRYLLVGQDFRFGAGRSGDFLLLKKQPWITETMPVVEVQGTRASSSALRLALKTGDTAHAHALLGRPYRISGHVVYGRQLGRTLGYPTLNIRFKHPKPAAQGIFIVQVHGLDEHPMQGVANLGTRPSLDSNDANAGQVLLEVYCLRWPLQNRHAYGKMVCVDLLHKLHDELQYPDLESLQNGIALDVQKAKTYFSSHTTETPNHA